MSIDKATKAMGDARRDARKTRSSGSEHDGGVGGAAKRFDGGCVGGIARLCEGLAGDSHEPRSCSGHGCGGCCGVSSHNADSERGREARGQLQSSGDGFERGFGERRAGFVGMSQYENRFHFSALLQKLCIDRRVRASVKGTGFSPYNFSQKTMRALAPEGKTDRPIRLQSTRPARPQSRRA
jgi:hypothetical protein